MKVMDLTYADHNPIIVRLNRGTEDQTVNFFTVTRETQIEVPTGI